MKTKNPYSFIHQIRGCVARTEPIATEMLLKKGFIRVREIFPDLFKQEGDVGLRRKWKVKRAFS